MEDQVKEPVALTGQVLRTPRSAGIAGVMFALLFGLAIYLLHTVVPPTPADAGSWLTDPTKLREVRFALALVPFSGIFFLWFMGAIRSRVGDAEDRFFSTVFLGSGFLFVAMIFVASAIMVALIALATRTGTRMPVDVWGLGRGTVFGLASTFSMRMAAVFMLATTTITRKLKIHAPVIVAIGYGAALLLMFAASSIRWIELLFPAWVLMISVTLLVSSYRSNK